MLSYEGLLILILIPGFWFWDDAAMFLKEQIITKQKKYPIIYKQTLNLKGKQAHNQTSIRHYFNHHWQRKTMVCDRSVSNRVIMKY